MSPPRFPTVPEGVTFSTTLLAVFAVACLVLAFECPAWGQTPLPLERLQPMLTPADVARWSQAIIAADTESAIGDPHLIAALIMRESSFRPRVADGTRRGALGEVGPLQVHGVALSFRPPGCKTGAGCWLRAGVRFLARRREDCPGGTWRWVAAYGMKSCPTEATARASKSARRARYWYDKIGGTTWAR